MMLASQHSTCALSPTRARSYEELAYALKYNKVRWAAQPHIRKCKLSFTSVARCLEVAS